MSQAKKQLELAIECLQRANRAQQAAFSAYKELIPEYNTIPMFFDIHNSIENVIEQLEELLDSLTESSN